MLSVAISSGKLAHVIQYYRPKIEYQNKQTQWSKSPELDPRRLRSASGKCFPSDRQCRRLDIVQILRGGACMRGIRGMG